MSDSDETLRTIRASIRRVEELWNDAARGWRDDVAREFHRDHLIPLCTTLEAYGEALERLLEAVETAKRL